MIKVEEILAIIKKLPHSETRVPYTYHHDYVRSHSAVCTGNSRSDVAQRQDWSEEELYATALVQLLEDCGVIIFKHIAESDLEKIQECIDITSRYINRIDQTL